MKKNTAIKIAIEAMEKMRKRYAVGHNAYLGFHKVPNQVFIFAKRDHDHYKRITEAIKVIDAARD